MSNKANSLVRYDQQSVNQSRWVLGLIGFGFCAALTASVFMMQQVFSDLQEQRTASSDNLQWTLTQVEVDYLSYLNTLEYQGLVLAEAESTPPNLDEVRRRFDVLYSRIDMLGTGRQFGGLRSDPRFGTPLKEVSGFLNDTVPIIDAIDSTLAERLQHLWREAADIREPVRALAMSGLVHFAEGSDQQRAQTTLNLTRLAALSGGLLLSLAALSAYLLHVNKKTQSRGRALRQTNERMNTILSTSLDALIVINSSGEVLEFNPAAEAIFGYSLEETKGRKIGDLIMPPHLFGAHKSDIERMQTKGGSHVVGQGRVQLDAMRANGEVFPAELALQSAFIEDEEIVIGFVRDISRSVADQKELISTRDRALASEKAKADFLTVMSHEIRTPLNGLLGNLTLLRNTSPTREQSQFIRNMDISGQILQSHVDTVLDIAQFEAGKLSVVSEPTDLSTMLQDLVDGQSGIAATRGNAISWQWVGTALPWVATDAQKVQQILLNLVGNAIKFTKNGRIQIEIEVTDPASTSDDPVFEFRVIDTGIGIKESEIDTVFDDFHTSDPSIGRDAGGTGLGLGIAHRFCQALGGEIGVESTADEGSVFWVRLPLQKAASQVEQIPKRPEAHQPEVLDLLVVEDNEINLEVICNMLEMDGHHVTTAANGQLGVDAAAQQRFDAILMDISMPVMDGLAATQQIRQGKGLSSATPVVAVSANVLPDAVERFSKAGMNAFIGKPISITKLRKALAVVTSGEMEIAGPTGNGQLETLRNDLGDSTFKGLLNRFLGEGEAFIESFKKMPTPASDLTFLAQECHKLAGSAAMFGAMEFRDALILVEVAATSDQQENVADLLHRVTAVWEQAKADLPPAA